MMHDADISVTSAQKPHITLVPSATVKTSCNTASRLQVTEEGAVSEMDCRLIDSFIEWKKAGAAAESSLRQRRYILTAFAREHRLLEATEECVVDYVGQPGRGANGKRTIISVLRIFYAWATARGITDRDPMALVHQVREERPLPKPVPEDVLRAALERADPEQRRAILLGAYGGLRLSEIAGFHSLWVGGGDMIVRGKGRVQRRVPIHPILLDELDFDGWAFPSWRKPGDHVSESYIADRVEAALGPPWTTHCLRHRFGTSCYRACRDIRVVQTLMGHSSPNTTARYIKVSDDSLAAAVLAVA